MESPDRAESNPEDREQGTPQGQLLGDEPASGDSSAGDAGTPEEGGADSVADAGGEGG